MKIIPRWLPPVAAWALLAVSVMGAVDARHQSRQLTAELAAQRDRQTNLENERRALLLEYHTFADLSQLREAAAAIGMRDPSPADGTLIFLPSHPTPSHPAPLNPRPNPTPDSTPHPEAAR